LVEIIRQFLNEEMMAFEFDDIIFNIFDKSDDPVVIYTVNQLWHFYDDCKDHKVALNKGAWDYINRLILLLESDGQIIIDNSRRWRFTQLLAFLGLLFFCVCIAVSGFGEHLLIVTVPLGVLSFVITWIRDKSEPVLSKNELALIPFKSRSEILALRRKLPDFEKVKYSCTLKNNPIRSPFFEKFLNCYWRVVWLMLSPLALLYQSFPSKNEVAHIIMPA